MRLRKRGTKPASSLARAALACFASTELVAGFLRRLQRNVQSCLAPAISGASFCSVPLALPFLREESSDFLRCPQLCLTVWQGSAGNLACGKTALIVAVKLGEESEKAAVRWRPRSWPRCRHGRAGTTCTAGHSWVIRRRSCSACPTL